MLVSQRKFAQIVNRSHTYINKLVKRGVIPTYDGGKIKVDEAKKMLEEYKDPSRDAQREANERRRQEKDIFAYEGEYPSIEDLSEEEKNQYFRKLEEEKHKAKEVLEEVKKSGVKIDGSFEELLGTMNLNQAKTVSEILTAKLKEIQYKKETGELVEKKEVEKEAFELGRRVRDAVLSVPDRVASIVASMSDSNAIKELLNNELRHALEILKAENGNL